MAINWMIPDKRGGSDQVPFQQRIPRKVKLALQEYASRQKTPPRPQTPEGITPSMMSVLLTLSTADSPEVMAERLKLAALIRKYDRQN